MGNDLSCANSILVEGWEATVADYLQRFRDGATAIGECTLKTLKDFALYFARAVYIVQDGSTLDVVRQFAIGAFNGMISMTPREFMSVCKDLLKAIVSKVLENPEMINYFKNAIQGCIDEFITNTALNSFCNEMFISMLERAREALANQLAGSPLSHVATGTLAGAAESAKRAFVSTAVVNTSLLGVSAAYAYYKYKMGYIPWDEYKRHVTKRAGATGGSIGGTTAGAAIGTLILPGVGTFVGGVIGGMAGDYCGSKAGEAFYDS